MDTDLPSIAPIVVTGAAGFIGAHVCRHLLQGGALVVGIDAFTEATGSTIKRDRIRSLCAGQPGWVLHEFDVSRPHQFSNLVQEVRPHTVVHLAAQPGIRRSFEDPATTAQHNLVGFQRVIEACSQLESLPHLLFASSSSVYGGHNGHPCHETQDEPRPQSLYASTKLANEWTAKTFARSRGLHSTGMRLFTTYGPWGRPDMALTRFADALWDGSPLFLRGHGAMERDFTYVEDTAATIASLIGLPPTDRSAPARVVNVGTGRPGSVREVAMLLARHMGQTPRLVETPAEPGEVLGTWACVEQLGSLGAVVPQTPLEQGVKRFAQWYSTYRTHCETG